MKEYTVKVMMPSEGGNCFDHVGGMVADCPFVQKTWADSGYDWTCKLRKKRISLGMKLPNCPAREVERG